MSRTGMQGIRVPGVLGVLLLGLCTPALAQDEVTFRFAPPDGLHLLLSQTDSETRFLAGRGTLRSTSRAQTDFRYSHADDGFELRTKALSFETRRDDVLIDDPVAKVLTGQTHVYRIGRDGQLQGVTGFDGLLERVQESFPPQVAQALAPMLDPAVLESAEKYEWKRRYGNYAGATVAVGDVWDATATLTLPSGQNVEHPVRTRFEASSGCGDAACIEIVTTSASAAGEVAPGTPAIRYEERRVLEPHTMRIHREKLDQQIEMLLPIEGEDDALARLTLTREYVYSSP